MVGEVSNGEDGESSGEVTGAFEGVRQAENSGTDDGDEDIGEGFELRGEVLGV